MAALTQHECNLIARKLNTRPRKRLDFRTLEQCLYERRSLLHFKVDSRPDAGTKCYPRLNPRSTTVAYSIAAMLSWSDDAGNTRDVPACLTPLDRWMTKRDIC